MSLLVRLNYLWRLFATGIAFTLFGIGGVLLPLLATPLLYLLPGGKPRRQVAARWLIHRLFLAFIHIMRLLGILSWRLEGKEKLDRKGLLILANHPTLIDIVFIIAFVPSASCIVKSKLLRNPAMRGFILHAGYITNDRGSALIEDARHALAQDANLVIFPEGTRSRPGENLQFQRGAANIAIRCQTDITPIVIDCNPPSLGKNQPWYDIPDRPIVLSFSIQDDIPITPFLAGSATLGARRLTERLEQFFTREPSLHGQHRAPPGAQNTDH